MAGAFRKGDLLTLLIIIGFQSNEIMLSCNFFHKIIHFKNNSMLKTIVGLSMQEGKDGAILTKVCTLNSHVIPNYLS